MSAATKAISQPIDDVAQDVKCNLIALGVKIYAGTLACLDGTNGAKPLTDTLMQAGATFLGVSRETYDNSAGAAAVAMQMLFQRATGYTFYAAKGADVPSVADIGKQVSAQDDQTIKETIAGTDLSCALVATDGSTFWRVRLP
jgi:hypothetical protein